MWLKWILPTWRVRSIAIKSFSGRIHIWCRILVFFSKSVSSFSSHSNINLKLSLIRWSLLLNCHAFGQVWSWPWYLISMRWSCRRPSGYYGRADTFTTNKLLRFIISFEIKLFLYLVQDFLLLEKFLLNLFQIRILEREFQMLLMICMPQDLDFDCLRKVGSWMIFQKQSEEPFDQGISPLYQSNLWSHIGLVQVVLPSLQ